MIKLFKAMLVSMILLFCGTTTVLATTTQNAANHTHPDQFLFVLKGKTAVVTENSDHTLSLKITGIAPKAMYMTYTLKMHSGFVKTNELLQHWKQWSQTQNQPLLVNFKSHEVDTVSGLIAEDPTKQGDWEFTIKPMNLTAIESKLHKRFKPLKVGTYHNITLSSDYLSIDLNKLPHSVCDLSMNEKQCQSLPLLVPAGH